MSETGTIDFSRPPQGELRASELIQAVSETGDLAERHYLEIKGSRFDISKKKDKQKIAKFILGAANRDPDDAERYFQGYAVMILGVDPNHIVGVQPTEMMELEHVIRPFLGASGPKWDIIRVPVKKSDKEVLVILVDPPQFGQPPFPCRADGEGLKNGAIYIRADGATREAQADEIDMLVRRGQRTVSDVRFEVGVVGAANPFHCDRSETLDAYINEEESRLLGALPIKPSPSFQNAFSSALSPTLLKLVSSSALDYLTIPEDRTQEEYCAEIQEWKKECGELWKTLYNHAVALFDANEIRIENKTSTYLRQVEVKIHLPGSVFTVRHEDLETAFRKGPASLGVPSSPRTWGPRKKDLGLPPLRPFDSGNYSLPIHKDASWENTGSVDITVLVGDLRPKATFLTHGKRSILVVPENFSDKTIIGTWTATAEGINELFEGKLVVPVSPIQDLTRIVRVLLGLEKLPKASSEQKE